MKTKTKQSIFNKVWRYFVIQKHPQAMGADSTCMYRGPKSNCAVGCQLPNYLYDPAMESESIDGVCKDFPRVKEYFGEDNIEFLEGIQLVHDSGEKPGGFQKTIKARLEELAGQYGLKIPVK